MEDLVVAAPRLPCPTFWRGKRVFLTGHTGFKGSWLALWLRQLGAEVTGFALPPPTTPNLFQIANVEPLLQRSIFGDIRDAAALGAALCQSRPQIILHLAAQALVSIGYSDPLTTYSTNVIGTLHLLEQARQLAELQALLVVTTDKCYENRETDHAYTEDDALGGYDPYSSSKACAEILTASWRRSFFSQPQQAALATARAGNVFGGGDWSANRLVPDLLAAFAAAETAILRHAQAVRPWQHVLEPLAGYLLLAEQLVTAPQTAHGAWNFAPELADCVRVETVAAQLAMLWSDAAHYAVQPSPLPHEAGLLRLDASRAKQRLGWRPRWNLARALRETVHWQRAWLAGQRMNEVCQQQIARYAQDATAPLAAQPTQQCGGGGLK